MVIEAKPLKYKKLDFLSERQLAEHYSLYNGYVNKLNETRARMQSADKTAANQTLSELRSLKRAETFALNGIKLHESYFEGMANPTKPSEKVMSLLNKSFNSFDDFKEEFKATALAVRGWVIMAYDLDEGKLRIFGADSHDNGAVWNCIPLLILDVYEHAYFMDYGAARKKYSESFMEKIDWSYANKVADKFNLM